MRNIKWYKNYIYRQERFKHSEKKGENGSNKNRLLYRCEASIIINKIVMNDGKYEHTRTHTYTYAVIQFKATVQGDRQKGLKCVFIKIRVVLRRRRGRRSKKYMNLMAHTHHTTTTINNKK